MLNGGGGGNVIHITKKGFYKLLILDFFTCYIISSKEACRKNDCRIMLLSFKEYIL